MRPEEGIVHHDVGPVGLGMAGRGGEGSEFEVGVAHVVGLVGAVGVRVQQREPCTKAISPALPLGLAGRRPVVGDPEDFHT
jgi:hypothetical protein